MLKIYNNIEGELAAPPQLKPSEITLKYLLEENIVSLIPVILQISLKAEREYENELYIDILNFDVKNYNV